MTLETALPAETQVSEASDQQNPAEALANTDETTAGEGHEPDLDEDGNPKPAKKEKTPEQREIERLRRGIDRKTRQLAEARAQSQMGIRTPQVAETEQSRERTNPASQTQDEPLTLSRAELDKLVKQEAERLAPTIRSQQAEVEHRREVVQGLAKEWGQEKFDTYASELDDVFGGLADAKGKPKPATEALFESEMPARLIEYLTNPDNADEAEEISRMGERQAVRAIAKLETKLEATKAKTPQRSNAAAPIEAIKAAGKAPNNMPDPANTKAYLAWANKQERGG